MLLKEISNKVNPYTIDDLHGFSFDKKLPLFSLYRVLVNLKKDDNVTIVYVYNDDGLDVDFGLLPDEFNLSEKGFILNKKLDTKYKYTNLLNSEEVL